METYSVIGLMSGTSGDGLDIAHCHFTKDEHWQYALGKCKTAPFPAELGRRLMNSHLLSALELQLLDVDLGKWMGDQVHQFCHDLPEPPLIVCSHGHTVFHQPGQGLSLQIGSGHWLAQRAKLPVINDFRMKDISLGGQGAPLVPIGDRLLFSAYDFCLNLGGISNISMEVKGLRRAFDCSPFNGLLNHFAKKLGAEYDDQGRWASEGKLNSSLLATLNALPYYQQSGAKSLGREDLERDFLPLLDQSQLASKDILATLIAHFAQQIASVIREHQTRKNARVLVTGGGAYHRFFLERLGQELPSETSLVVPEAAVLEFKEALIFGFLGVLKLREEKNCLASVTGAAEDSSGGTWYDYRSSKLT